MRRNAILTLLHGSGAILKNDHFVLTSGKHSPLYITKDAAYTHPEVSSAIGKLFAERFKLFAIDAVAAPALGGIVLSQWTAFYLSKKKKKEVLSVFAEKMPDQTLSLTRGYDTIVRGKKILVIEDTVTTGGSVLKVVQSVRNAGGIIAAVGVMVNRNPEVITESMFNAPFFSLAELPVESYEPESCPMCQKKIPINIKVGHGKKFLQEKKD
jgi:orotate phosphoribosyltransferase